MKLVADTNVLFGFFLNSSFSKRFLSNTKIEIISSEKAIDELRKYSKLIIEKTNLNKNSFEKELDALKKIVKFENKKKYLQYLTEAEKISPDKDDSDFLALCLKHSCFLWSNDLLLKSQNKVKVLTTKEIIEILF